MAEQGEHLEVLQWLRANSCPEWGNPNDSEDSDDE